MQNPIFLQSYILASEKLYFQLLLVKHKKADFRHKGLREACSMGGQHMDKVYTFCLKLPFYLFDFQCILKHTAVKPLEYQVK